MCMPSGEYVQNNISYSIHKPVCGSFIINTLRQRQHGRRLTKDIFNAFFDENYCNSDWHFIENFGSDNGLVPVSRQAIVWIKDGQVYLRIYASLGLKELRC